MAPVREGRPSALLRSRESVRFRVSQVSSSQPPPSTQLVGLRQGWADLGVCLFRGGASRPEYHLRATRKRAAVLSRFRRVGGQNSGRGQERRSTQVIRPSRRLGVELYRPSWCRLRLI